MNLNLEKYPDPVQNIQFSLRGVSYLALNPGDIIQFLYKGYRRFGLVVSSRRASRGVFLSTQKNRLLNIVELGGLTEAMFSLMINNLYRNRVACSYSSRILGTFLGKDNFKTFNIAKIAKILSYEIG